MRIKTGRKALNIQKRIMYFDTHSHLTLCEEHIDIPQHISEAQEAGIRYILDPGIHPSDFQTRKKKLSGFDHVLLGLAAAPHAKERATREDIEEMKTILKTEKVHALSEIGLEYFHFPEEKDRAYQRELLAMQCEIATAYDLPVFLHIRDAFDDALSILKENKVTRAAVHCFTGDVAQAKKFLDQGYFLSFSGIVTFKNAKEVQASAIYCPLEQMLTETDAPYLAPVPVRGKKNKSPYMLHTCEFLAREKNLDLEKFNAAVFKNAVTFLDISFLSL